MTTRIIQSSGARIFFCATTLALAAAFTVAPAVTAPLGYGDVAIAKEKGDKGDRGGGRDKGDRGRDKGDRSKDRGKDRDRGGKSAERSDGQSRSDKGTRGGGIGRAFKESPFGKLLGGGKQKKAVKSQVATAPAAPKKPAKQVKRAETRTVAAEAPAETETVVALKPSQKGRWNAANASEQAIRVHMEKGKFNGTIGALAELTLTAKAASGAELNAAEAASLAGLMESRGLSAPAGISDEEVAEALNGALPEDAGYSFDYVDGELTCTGTCDEVDMEQAALDADLYRVVEETDQVEASYGDLYAAAEQRIIDESNKPLEPAEQEALLDDLVSRLAGVDRAALAPAEEVPAADPAEGDVVGDATEEVADPAIDSGDEPLVVVENPVEVDTGTTDNF